MADETKKGPETTVTEPPVDTEETEAEETETEETETEETATEEPGTEKQTTETATTETQTDQPPAPEKPAVDVEAEVERRAAERIAAREAELLRKHEEEKQRAIDAVIARERKKEDSARKALRDFEAKYGMSLDKAAEANRETRVQQLVTEKGWDEGDARKYVALEEERALARAREEDEKRERMEFTATNTYRQQKLDFLSSKDAPDIYRKALQKYGDEIDAFANHGRPDETGGIVQFDVALKFIAGQHLPEIQKELAADYEAKLAAKAAEVEAARKAGEQRAIRNITTNSKAKPETSTAGVTPPEASLTPMELATAKAFGMSPAAYAKAKSNTNPRPKSR